MVTVQRCVNSVEFNSDSPQALVCFYHEPSSRCSRWLAAVVTCHGQVKGGWGAIAAYPRAQERNAERKGQSRSEKAGLPRYLAEKPPVRRCGPLPQLIGLDGLVVSMRSNAHPFGPQKRKYIDREQED